MPFQRKYFCVPGGSRSQIYQTWLDMKHRCGNPKCKAFRNYGGRGIRVCLDWLDFNNFARDMASTWWPGATIERIDNDGPYCFTNCRWATMAEQLNNTRRNHRVEFNGKVLNVAQWAKILGIGRTTLYSRLNRSMRSPEAAFTARKYVHL